MVNSIKKDKKEVFIKLAETRTNKALTQIKNIGNLSNKNNYQYTEDQAKKIVHALKNAVNEVENKFKQKAGNEEFRL